MPIAAALDVTVCLDAALATAATSIGSSTVPTPRIVEHVVAATRASGWEVLVEYGFNHYGDRGSVDVLAWHAGSRARC